MTIIYTLLGAILIASLFSCHEGSGGTGQTEKEPPVAEEQQPASDPGSGTATSDLLHPPEALPAVKGMVNLTNTCFANAATALFLEIPEVCHLLEKDLTPGNSTLKNESRPQYDARVNFQKAAYDLAVSRSSQGPENLAQELNKYFDTISYANLLINGSEKIGGKDGAALRKDQGDAADFLINVFDYLEYPGTKWGSLFKFSDGSTRIIDEHSSLVNLSLDQTDPKEPLSFQEVVNKATDPEWLTGENMVTGPDGTKMDCQKIPGFLTDRDHVVFKLERSSLDLVTGERKKLTQKVNLSNHIFVQGFREGESRTVKLSLKAVVVHGGSSAAEGHYYTYVYSYQHEMWILYNDSSVTWIDRETVRKDVSANGYLFLYLGSRN